MGRLVGEHFNRDGLPKRGFDTFLLAQTFAQEYGLVAYECSVCGKWHLARPRDSGDGSPPRRRPPRR